MSASVSVGNSTLMVVLSSLAVGRNGTRSSRSPTGVPRWLPRPGKPADTCAQDGGEPPPDGAPAPPPAGPARRLVGERRLELLLLVFREVRGDDLELRPRLEGLDDPVDRHLPDQQEQRRTPRRHLAAHLLDEVLADPVVAEVPGEGTHRRAQGGAEERDK